MQGLTVDFASSALDIEQVRDLRRSVLCGELHWPRDIVQGPQDDGAHLALAMLGPKPVASGRLSKHEGDWAVDLIAVVAALRQKGVGRAVMEALEAKAKALGIGRLAAISPPESLVFFEQLGYKVYRRDDGFVILEKWLV